MKSKNRGAVTILELLAVLVVIGILSSILLVALRGAQQDAIEANTRATVAKIHEVIASRWAEHLATSVKSPISETTLNELGTSPIARARIQLNFLRDSLRMAFPDRVGDLSRGPAVVTISGDTSAIPYNVETPVIYTQLNARFYGPSASWTEEFADAELLYAIVDLATVNGGPAMEMFRQSEIADKDNDGFPEFVDGWGTPVRFVRWPVGYQNREGVISEIDPMLYATLARRFAGDDATLRSLLKGFRGADPVDVGLSDWGYDMINPLLPYAVKFPLFPLVVSAGPDREFGMNFNLYTPQGFTPILSYADISWTYSNGPRAAEFTSGSIIDPYHPRYPRSPTDLQPSDVMQPGQVIDSALADDNVSNFDQLRGTP